MSAEKKSKEKEKNMEAIRGMGKGRFYIGILIMVMLVLDTSQPGAEGSLVKELSGTTIIADNMELEFLMDSEISRKLADGSSHFTDASLVANKPVTGCRKYTSCVPPKNKPKKGETCGTHL
ncbi:hypothetical protein PTKIN_Ptkin15bG0177400 [Pterospermum kingtungense]